MGIITPSWKTRNSPGRPDTASAVPFIGAAPRWTHSNGGASSIRIGRSLGSGNISTARRVNEPEPGALGNGGRDLHRVEGVARGARLKPEHMRHRQQPRGAGGGGGGAGGDGSQRGGGGDGGGGSGGGDRVRGAARPRPCPVAATIQPSQRLCRHPEPAHRPPAPHVACRLCPSQVRGAAAVGRASLAGGPVVRQVVQDVLSSAAGRPPVAAGGRGMERLKEQQRLVCVGAQNEQVPDALLPIRPVSTAGRKTEEQQLTLAHGQAGQPPYDAGERHRSAAVGSGQAKSGSVVAETRWPRLGGDSVRRQLRGRSAESKRQPDRREQARHARSTHSRAPQIIGSRNVAGRRMPGAPRRVGRQSARTHCAPAAALAAGRSAQRAGVHAPGASGAQRGGGRAALARRSSLVLLRGPRLAEAVVDACLTVCRLLPGVDPSIVPSGAGALAEAAAFFPWQSGGHLGQHLFDASLCDDTLAALALAVSTPDIPPSFRSASIPSRSCLVSAASALAASARFIALPASRRAAAIDLLEAAVLSPRFLAARRAALGVAQHRHITRPRAVTVDASDAALPAQDEDIISTLYEVCAQQLGGNVLQPLGFPATKLGIRCLVDAERAAGSPRAAAVFGRIWHASDGAAPLIWARAALPNSEKEGGAHGGDGGGQGGGEGCSGGAQGGGATQAVAAGRVAGVPPDGGSSRPARRTQQRGPLRLAWWLGWGCGCGRPGMAIGRGCVMCREQCRSRWALGGSSV
eukprot:scaffold6383_cov112-Isochrysis_galbana.AAC.4